MALEWEKGLLQMASFLGFCESVLILQHQLRFWWLLVFSVKVIQISYYLPITHGMLSFQIHHFKHLAFASNACSGWESRIWWWSVSLIASPPISLQERVLTMYTFRIPSDVCLVIFVVVVFFFTDYRYEIAVHSTFCNSLKPKGKDWDTALLFDKTSTVSTFAWIHTQELLSQLEDQQGHYYSQCCFCFCCFFLLYIYIYIIIYRVNYYIYIGTS